jgi:hypothetical protein
MLVLAGSTLASEEEALLPIRDNSFFIEEAYNQEPGVIQHILFAPSFFDSDRHGHRSSSQVGFTEEWPLFSQLHQLSLSSTYSVERDSPRHEDRERVRGFGDLFINYRFQALPADGGLVPTASPRLSLILPAGHDAFESEDGGLQFNLPLSWDFGPVAAHANAGATWLWNAREEKSDPHDLLSWNLGASLIWHATPTLNFLVETAWSFDDVFRDDRDGTKHETVGLVAPGVRWAVNFESGAQIVLGASVPIGITAASPDWGVALYLSIEHALAFLAPEESSLERGRRAGLR